MYVIPIMTVSIIYLLLPARNHSKAVVWDRKHGCHSNATSSLCYFIHCFNLFIDINVANN